MFPFQPKIWDMSEFLFDFFSENSTKFSVWENFCQMFYVTKMIFQKLK